MVSLARTYRVSLPVLTAVAQVNRHFRQAVCKCKDQVTELHAGNRCDSERLMEEIFTSHRLLRLQRSTITYGLLCRF